MLNFDFTDQLPATLPGVNRNQVVKFNNSWLRVAQNAGTDTYLVVYRAMVHKVRDAHNNWVFANPAPTLPGQEGTPWGSGWGAPDGDAILEGQVPDARGGRYFDGIGVAQITLDTTNLGNLGAALNVVGDRILLNSDGYEDPRIFEADGRYFIHSHRYQPDNYRGANGPQHRVYTGYTPERTPFTPGDIATANRALFVKVTELEFRNNRPFLGAEFYYGSNVSDRIEKNYGFFMDGDTLCAVYGVAPNDRPFTMLRAVRGLGGQAVHQFPRGGRFLVEEFQPNTDPNTNNERDCFLRIQRYYENLIPGAKTLYFSSSGPLLWNGASNRWQGVGHVKILHQRIFSLADQLVQCAFAMVPQLNLVANPADLNETYQRMIDVNDDFLDDVTAHLLANPNDALPYVAAYLNIIPGNVGAEDHRKFLNAFQFSLIRGSLLRRVIDAHSMQQGIVYPWAGNILPNPRLHNDNRVIMHPQCIYMSFFYELEQNSYRLNRFSNAFLVYDANHPHFLQFASNLAPIGNDYLMAFGEDDNRAKAFQLTAHDYQQLMNHDATNFNPANFSFRRLNVNEQVL